jgi:hypothetical protein
MASFKRLSLILLTTCAGTALSACDGANDIASPGSSGNVIINNPAPAPTPSPTPTPTSSLVVAATGCPTIADPRGLTDSGTITGPTGTWRVCTLPSIISRSIQLPKIAGLVYEMRNRVDVGCDGGITAPTTGAPVTSSTVGCTAANGFTLTNGQLTADTNITLTIDPGVILFGGTGTSWLAVNRGNKINAVGTAAAPIIFTSRDNILGINNDSSFGQWGGVVLMGRAKITDCTTGTTTGNTCERQTEGSTDPAVYGGNDDTWNSGSMKYVQIRYSGYVLGANTELQGLTTEGTGSGTSLEYIQSHNSSDDGAEFFGGVVNFKHYIATGADDDSLDIDTGLRGAFQYVLLLQRPGQGDALMEVDSNGFEGDTPRQTTRVVNFTAVQGQTSANNEGSDLAAILLRGNADLTLANGIVATPNNECLRMNGSGTATQSATLAARSVVLTCNATKYLGSGTYTAAQVATSFGSGANNNNDAFTSTLTGGFINGANETGVAAFDAKTLNAFFDTTTYIGAVKDANDNWYKSWTCNSGYAAFDDTANSLRSCTSLPK